MTESSPIKPFETNNVIPRGSMADKYKKAYDTLFERLSIPMQKRVLANRNDISIRDLDVNKFIEEVILLAETEDV